LTQSSSSGDTDQRSGKIKRVRTHGKLVFFDIVHGDVEVQIMLQVGFLVKHGTYSQAELTNLVNVMQTGDYYGMC
jgi:lysyl-tRNA synthetase class II